MGVGPSKPDQTRPDPASIPRLRLNIQIHAATNCLLHACFAFAVGRGLWSWCGCSKYTRKGRVYETRQDRVGFARARAIRPFCPLAHKNHTRIIYIYIKLYVHNIRFFKPSTTGNNGVPQHIKLCIYISSRHPQSRPRHQKRFLCLFLFLCYAIIK